MPCEFCHRDFGHTVGCPNYILPKCKHYCSICGDGIYNGDEYIKNDNEEYIHWDCWQSCRDLVKWLGYEIKTMDENDE